jgi:arylamine N-acetyltransferase
MNKLHLGFEDITKIYAEALEHETGMPVENLDRVFDYDSYELKYDSLADKIIIKILGAYVQFEMEDTDIYVINYGNGSGWQIGYSFAD